MSWYELSHGTMVAKGHMFSIMEKLEELMVIAYLDEISERENIA